MSIKPFHEIISKFMKYKIILISLIYLLILGGTALYKTTDSLKAPASPQFYAQQFLDQKIQELANRYSNGDVIVVSKKDHLLYYCHNGLIVRGDRFGGFVYNFPVPVSLGVNNRWTPEGKFKIYVKNPQSRYTLFLGFLGAYGIHGAETRLATKLNWLESFDPNLKYVTRKDNTLGCVAVENRVIRYLYANVNVDTPVFIF